MGLVHRWADKSRLSKPFPVGIRKNTLSFLLSLKLERMMSLKLVAPNVPPMVPDTSADTEMNKERELVLIPLFRVLDAAVPEVWQHPTFPFS